MKQKRNIFFGNGLESSYAKTIYKFYKRREWFTYSDIIDEFYIDSPTNKPVKISYGNQYNQLKKAFCELKKLLTERFGKDCIEVDGNNRNKRFRYIGEDIDPLADMLNAKVVSNLREYWQFCQDSAGFFPASWLEHFFKDYQDLLEIKKRKQKGEQMLSTSIDRNLKNIDLLPILYQAIADKKVLSIKYQPYGEDLRELTFHPHYLKEYNGRWFLFGHSENDFPEYGYNIALDRIVGKPLKNFFTKYIPSPSSFYQDFFKNIVGVSHLPNAKVYKIRIRAHTLKAYKLMDTKKLHHSQETMLEYGNYNDGEYGDFSVVLEMNNEFIGRILQMGAGLEIISPLEVREVFKQCIQDMKKLYE